MVEGNRWLLPTWYATFAKWISASGRRGLLFSIILVAEGSLIDGYGFTEGNNRITIADKEKMT